MIRFITATLFFVCSVHHASAQVSDDDQKAVQEMMEKATEKLGQRQQKALKDVTDKGGFKGGDKDRLSSVTAEEFASVFKAMGLLSGSTNQPAYGTIGAQMLGEDGETRAKIIRGYHLIEQASLLSKKPGFKFQNMPEADRKLVLANLTTCKDELLFAGLPYAERASAIRKRLAGK